MEKITKKDFINNLVNNETKLLGSIDTIEYINDIKIEKMILNFDSSSIDIRTAAAKSNHIEFSNLSRLDIHSNDTYFILNDSYLLRRQKYEGNSNYKHGLMVYEIV